MKIKDLFQIPYTGSFKPLGLMNCELILGLLLSVASMDSQDQALITLTHSKKSNKESDIWLAKRTNQDLVISV